MLDSRRSTQRMNAITLARAIRRPGDTVELDFQNPLHREWILSLYDGEETVKRQLPAFHDAYTRTVKTPLVSALPRGGDFVSGAEVEGVHWERNGNLLSVRAVSSLSDTALFIDEQLEIRTAAGERVDSYAQSTADAHHTVLTLETEFDPAKFQSDILEVDYTVTWAEADTGRLRALMGSRDIHSGGQGSIQIGSDLAESAKGDPGSAQAGWLNLIWGCLASGTRILMADGSEKPIEQIQVEDQVYMDAQKNIAVVTALVQGNEPRSMVSIQMLGGRTLVCTQDHPVVTNQGIMKAADLHGNCRLCTPDGGQVTIIGIWDTPGGDIYNLELMPQNAQQPPDEGCTMFAEGVLVGDNMMQGTLGIVREELPKVNPHRGETEKKRALWEAMK